MPFDEAKSVSENSAGVVSSEYWINLLTVLRSENLQEFETNSAAVSLSADPTDDAICKAMLREFFTVKENPKGAEFLAVTKKQFPALARIKPEKVDAEYAEKIENMSPDSVKRYLNILKVADYSAAKFDDFPILLAVCIFKPSVSFSVRPQGEIAAQLARFKSYMNGEGGDDLIKDIVANLFAGSETDLAEVSDDLSIERDRLFSVERETIINQAKLASAISFDDANIQELNNYLSSDDAQKILHDYLLIKQVVEMKSGKERDSALAGLSSNIQRYIGKVVQPDEISLYLLNLTKLVRNVKSPVLLRKLLSSVEFDKTVTVISAEDIAILEKIASNKKVADLYSEPPAMVKQETAAIQKMLIELPDTAVELKTFILAAFDEETQKEILSSIDRYPVESVELKETKLDELNENGTGFYSITTEDHPKIAETLKMQNSDAVDEQSEAFKLTELDEELDDGLPPSREFNLEELETIKKAQELKITEELGAEVLQAKQQALYVKNWMTLLRSNSYEQYASNSTKLTIASDETMNVKWKGILQDFFVAKEYYNAINSVVAWQDADKAKAIVGKKASIYFMPADLERNLAIIELSAKPATEFGNFQILVKEFLLHPEVKLKQSADIAQQLEQFRKYMLGNGDDSIVPDLVAALFAGPFSTLDEISRNIIADHKIKMQDYADRFKVSTGLGGKLISRKVFDAAEEQADFAFGQQVARTIVKPEDDIFDNPEAKLDAAIEEIEAELNKTPKASKPQEHIRTRIHSAPARLKKHLSEQFSRVLDILSPKTAVKSIKSVIKDKQEQKLKQKPEWTIEALKTKDSKKDVYELALLLKRNGDNPAFIEQLKTNKLADRVFEIAMSNRVAAQLIISTRAKEGVYVYTDLTKGLLTAEQLTELAVKYQDEQDIMAALSSNSPATFASYLTQLVMKDLSSAKIILNAKLDNKLDEGEHAELLSYLALAAITKNDFELARLMLINNKHDDELEEAIRKQLINAPYFSNVHQAASEDLLDAAKFFADKGSAHAQYYLAQYYFDKTEQAERNSETNVSEAAAFKGQWFDYLTKAAGQDHPKALQDLAFAVSRDVFTIQSLDVDLQKKLPEKPMHSRSADSQGTNQPQIPILRQG